MLVDLWLDEWDHVQRGLTTGDLNLDLTLVTRNLLRDYRSGRPARSKDKEIATTLVGERNGKGYVEAPT